jgi:hypothetical protein
MQVCGGRMPLVSCGPALVRNVCFCLDEFFRCVTMLELSLYTASSPHDAWFGAQH